MARLDAATGPFSYFRLIGNREATENLTTTITRIVIDQSEDLADCARSIEERARRVPVVVFASNHYAGYAPETARTLHRMLGLPEVVPLDAAADHAVRLIGRWGRVQPRSSSRGPRSSSARRTQGQVGSAGSGSPIGGRANDIRESRGPLSMR